MVSLHHEKRETKESRQTVVRIQATLVVVKAASGFSTGIPSRVKVTGYTYGGLQDCKRSSLLMALNFHG